MQVTDDDMLTLENMIDRTSIAAVLSALSGVCELKAEHIDTNWQDKHLASRWRRWARTMERTARTWNYPATRD